ncbi:Conserved_hypothetical protein [Hexamita inflata]|uniref:Uncharacterized protein n=1 Tax=Hexamita inflata TaxID=28002 RepID=A0AA86TYZ9_9EUKA|nr:Conserved hypothetical protein [Hexamita inflata]
MNLYMSIDNQYIKIYNRESILLQKHFLETDFSDHNTCTAESYYSYNEQYINTLILCAGTLYIQIHENVYYLQNGALTLAAQIPSYCISSSTSKFGRMFSFKGNLYVQNGIDSLFMLKDNKFEYVKFMNIDFFQFCDKVFAFSSRQSQIWRVNDNLELEYICGVEPNAQVQFCSGGVIVISGGWGNTYILDMSSGSVLRIPMLNYERQLADTGVQMGSYMLCNLFGNQVLARMKEQYNAFLTEQTNEIYKREIWKCISFKVLFTHCKELLEIWYDYKVQKPFKKIESQIKVQLHQLKSQIVEATRVWNIMSNMYMNSLQTHEQ